MADFYSLALPVSSHSFLDGPSPIRLDPSSPKRLREAVEKLAYYFKREMQFDHVQFEASETPTSLGFVPYEAYLFFEPAYDRITEDQPVPKRIFGACCFRLREWSDHEPTWSLDWAWMHPFFRRRGHLRTAWQMFEQRYGEGLHLAAPLSLEMKAFLDATKSLDTP